MTSPRRMSGIHDLGLFVAAGLLLNVTPGPDMAYIAARSAAGGFRAGVAATLGITAGCVVHTLAAAAGLSVLLATSAAAFDVVKWCGAAVSPLRGHAPDDAAQAARAAPAPRADRRAAPARRRRRGSFARRSSSTSSTRRSRCSSSRSCRSSSTPPRRQGARVRRARLPLQLQQPVRQPSGRVAREPRRAAGLRASAPGGADPRAARVGASSCCSPRGSRRSSGTDGRDAAARIEARPARRDVRGESRRDGRAGRRPAREGRRGRAGRRRRGARAARRRAASCCRASACARCSIRARRSSSSRSSPRTACTTTTSPAAGIITGIGRVAGPRVRDRLQRRDGQGRHLLSDDGEEAPARAGDRAREPPAVHLPRRLRRRQPAEPGRGVSRPRSLRPHLLQPGDDVGAKASRRSPWSWARAPPAAPTCRRCPTSRSSSRSRARSSSAARRW